MAYLPVLIVFVLYFAGIPIAFALFGAASSYATMTYVGKQISAARHISKSIVETLPAVKDAQDNVIYMIKKATPDGSNLYDEYMLISGALEKIGDTKTVIEAITNTQIDTILAS